MKTDLQSTFIVDKEKNTITVRREFAADRQLVWDCHTKSGLLEKWFAPKPFMAKTKSMDFSAGGHWHYAMISPEGQEYWGYTSYDTVSPIDGYTSTDAFCDAEATINTEMPRAKWAVTFTDKGDNTIVTTVVTYGALKDLEEILQMGMEEGLMATLVQLDELLAELKA